MQHEPMVPIAGDESGSPRRSRFIARSFRTSTRMMDTVHVEIYPEASRAVADAIDEVVRRSVTSESAEG